MTTMRSPSDSHSLKEADGDLISSYTYTLDKVGRAYDRLLLDLFNEKIWSKLDRG